MQCNVILWVRCRAQDSQLSFFPVTLFHRKFESFQGGSETKATYSLWFWFEDTMSSIWDRRALPLTLPHLCLRICLLILTLPVPISASVPASNSDSPCPRLSLCPCLQLCLSLSLAQPLSLPLLVPLAPLSHMLLTAQPRCREIRPCDEMRCRQLPSLG